MTCMHSIQKGWSLSTIPWKPIIPGEIESVLALGFEIRRSGGVSAVSGRGMSTEILREGHRVVSFEGAAGEQEESIETRKSLGFISTCVSRLEIRMLR